MYIEVDARVPDESTHIAMVSVPPPVERIGTSASGYRTRTFTSMLDYDG